MISWKNAMLLCVAILFAASLSAQYTYTVTDNTSAGQNPGGLNTQGDTTTTGWTQVVAGPQSTNSWSATQTIPFTFEFYGNVVTGFRASSNGLVTFDTLSTALPSANDNLPSVNLPDNTICVFWDDFTGTNSGDDVDMQVFGSPGSQQLWIRWYSFKYGGCSYCYFGVVLEEGTNKIYVMDESYYSGSITSTVGVQENSSNATQFGTNTLNWANSSSSSNTNNGWYEFTPVPPDQLAVVAGISSGLAAAGDTDATVGAFTLAAQNTATQDVASVTVTLTGTASPGSLSNLKLWNDQNSNGMVDTGEPQLGSTVAALSGSTATFSGAPLISLAAGTSADLLLTADVGGGVSSGDTIAFEINASGDVSSTPGPIHGAFPVSLGSGRTIVTYTSSLPYTENFDGASLNANVSLFNKAGNYPTSTAVGATPGTGTRSADAIALRSTIPIGNISAHSGSNYFYETHNTGGSCAGVDMFFDLSSYNSAGSNLELSFYWIDDGMDTLSTNTVFNFAFISLDGGNTWFTTLYNIDTSGTTAVWNKATINLSNAVANAGGTFSNRVVVRIQASDDSSSDALGIDDIVLRNVPSSLEVNSRPVPGSNSGFAISPTGDIVVLAAELTAQQTNQTVSDITVHNNGSVADANISAVKLWLDNNGNGLLETSDTQLGSNQTFSGGSTTFSGLTLGVNVGTPVDIIVTYTFGTGAAGTAGASINAASDITATPGPVFAQYPATFPIADNVGTLVAYNASLPYNENFDATLADNIVASTVAGSYPTATGVGSTTASGTTANDGVVSLEGSFLGTTPNSGSTQATFHFDNGQAVAAMDFYFDLSSYNAATDQIEFSFAWNDDGLDSSTTANDPFDYVFISTDGGATWATAIYFIDPSITTSTSTNAYSTATVDISQILNSVSASFTNQMVIRIQAADNTSADCLMVDDVALDYIPPTAPVVGAPIAPASPNSIKITEVACDPGTSGDEYCEIQNTSAAAVTLSNWTVTCWDGSTSPIFTNTINATTLQPGDTYVFCDYSSATNPPMDQAFSANLLWDGSSCGVLIQDDTGAVVDCVFWGNMTVANITSPVTIGANWTGSALPNQTLGQSFQRTGSSDNNDSSDWSSSTAPDLGTTNTGLNLPLPTGGAAMQIGGTAPNYTATVDLGNNLDFIVTSTDVNTADTLSYTVTVTGGSLTAAQAGFDQVFTTGVYNDPNPNQPAPHDLAMSGVASALGTISLQIDCSDGIFTSTITLDITIQAGAPIIRTRNVPTMDFFTYATGTPSVFELSFDVAGFSLTNDLVVTAPTDFQVSTTSGSNFGSTVTLTPSGSIVPFTTIYVRYNPTTVGPHSETITIDSSPATGDTIQVTGQIIPATAPVLEPPKAPFADGSVLFSELAQDPGPTGDEYIEVTNVSGGPVDIAGWTIAIYYSNSTTPQVTHVVTGAVLQPGDTFTFVDVSSSSYIPSAEYLGVNIGSWTNYGLVLLDTNSNVQDVIATGTYDPTTITSPVAITPAMWSGAGFTSPPYTDTAKRTGTTDHNDASDWAVTTGDTLGTVNTGLTLPFNLARYIVITGTSPNWTGDVFVGDDLGLTFDTTDVNTLETLTYTVTVTGGSLTAAQAGFNETFTGGAYNDPAPGVSPHQLTLSGTAATAGTLTVMVEVTDGMFTQSYTLALTVHDIPTITTSGTPLLPFFSPTTGTPSPEQSYTVSGTALLSDVTITAPAPFEISQTSGSGFANQLTLAPSGGTLAATTIFVRYNPTGSGPDMATLGHTASYASAVNLSLAGYVGPVPVLTVTGTPLNQFSTGAAGTPSAEQTFNLSGVGVVGDVTVTAPANFEVSRTASVGFGSSVVLPLYGGNFPTTTVFVRYNPLAGSGTNHSGSISISTPGATPVTVAVDGTISSSSGSSGGGGGGGGGGGCVAAGNSSGMWGLLLGALALLLVVSRIRATRD